MSGDDYTLDIHFILPRNEACFMFVISLISNYEL
jgi:hypothetical protein